MTFRVTSSELRQWRTCRRTWYLRYYLQLQKKRNPEDVSPARTGSLYARGVEEYYGGGSPEYAREVVRGLADTNADQLDAVYKAEAAKKVRSNAELVDIMLAGFFDWLEETGVDANLEFIGAEEEISVEHPQIPGVLLLGKLDQLARVRSSGEELIIDNKTVQTAADQELTAPLNQQFQHYSMIRRLTDPMAKFAGARVRWARRVKRTARAAPPFYGEIEVPLPRDLLLGYYEQATETIREIMEARLRLDRGEPEVRVCGPNPSRDNCRGCALRPFCADMTSGIIENSVLAWSFEKTDPLARYESTEEDDGE